MARRSRRGLAAGLAATLALAACSGKADEATTTTGAPMTTSTTSATTTVPTVTSTTASATPTTDATEVDLEVMVPDGEGPFPAVVLVHGGGWVTGATEIMEPLAGYLTDAGYLTANTGYALADFDRPGYPAAVDDVACAVRFAADHPDSDGTVTLIGHSAGAHIGALVALTGDRYGGQCASGGSGIPDRFIGLAGPYDVSRLGLAVSAFFGGRQDRFPDLWDAGNPQLLTDENTELDSLIMYGENDGLVPESFAVSFHNALLESGSGSLLELVEGARHNDLHDPELVGALILAWLERADS